MTVRKVRVPVDVLLLHCRGLSGRATAAGGTRHGTDLPGGSPKLLAQREPRRLPETIFHRLEPPSCVSRYITEPRHFLSSRALGSCTNRCVALGMQAASTASRALCRGRYGQDSFAKHRAARNLPARTRQPASRLTRAFQKDDPHLASKPKPGLRNAGQEGVCWADFPAQIGSSYPRERLLIVLHAHRHCSRLQDKPDG